MRTTLHCLLLLLVPLLAQAGEPLTFCESFGSGDNKSHSYSWILYGHRDHRIAFIIFQTTHGKKADYSKHIHLTLNSTNTAAGFANVGEGWIDMPDGTKRDLPSSRMVFEYTDGAFHSAPIEMDEEDFSRYIWKGQTNAWDMFRGLTVKELKEYEKSLKAKSSNPQGGANGRQPFGSETNQTSSSAASRRSP
jgi:hypothetical protein